MQNQKEILSKLKFSSLLDLALFVPSNYDDTTLSNSLSIGEEIVALARVESVKKLGNKLQINLFLPKFKRVINATLFKVTPYHFAAFSIGSELFMKGKLSEFNGFLQFSQPKKITMIDKIIPKYKTTLKNSEVLQIVESLISYENLKNEGLNEVEIQTILMLHFPKNLSDILLNKIYKSDIIKTLKIIEAYNHLKKLKGKRVDFPPSAILDNDIKSFISSLPFNLTDEQLKVIYEIKADFLNPKKAAKRVIIGDVGSGKTLVILASAMMALPKKSILMAPTSLLAFQLYEEAIKFLPKSIKIALVMQSKNIGDYKEADFIIGTHALLYKDDLPQIDLVMVDEQHRFGTNQRNLLSKLTSKKDKKAHGLQFSATPIPRTQAMMDSALVDVSLITTTPFDKDTSTQIISKDDFSSLLSCIKSEISKGYQILIVYPLVEQSEQIPYQSIDEARGFWEKNFENVYVTHGKDKEKDEVLLDFREKGDILLATTVVEVGISLPRLTLVVIVGAERLGLATLHQLRGRVGRLGIKSHCYLYTHNIQNERLEKFANTTSGFDIARLDLEFRNSGDIIDGTMQSGQKFKWLDMANDEEIIKNAMTRV
ncbi:MAG: ATP-dependent DNA helicase RecG [Sulfurovaceae bacterium]|nr:ATP-dependent DNA helicase RecG [Sulfurovaceae bacterium]MDD5548359.1 ATP-dependent DNA helicase RecG [Sulfurovaceae bacterium]